MSTKFLKLPEGRIAFDDAGQGPLVICVPSMGDVRAEYRFLIPELVAAGYRVVSMDVRGHGESSTEWKDFSVAAVGSDILSLVRELGAGPAVVIGTSMAAGAAIWAAAEQPAEIEALVLLGPAVRGSVNPFLVLLVSVLLARPWGPGMWRRYYSSLYPTRRPADFAEYTAALRANLAQPGRVEALKAMAAASKEASEERIPSVQQPALVMMGSKDPDFPKPAVEAQWVAESLHGQCELLEGVGHYPHAEMPDVTAPRIVSFLRSIHRS